MSEQVLDKAAVLRTLRAHREEFQRLGVARIGLFGSFVRGSARSTSDVDILVEFGPAQKSLDRFMALCDLLESVFDRRVDVVTVEALSPHIGPHILKEVEYVSIAA